VLHVWDGAKVKRSPVEWAFRWVSDFPEVKVILSGVSSMEQLKENIRIFNDTKPLSLTEEERVMFKKAQDIYKSKFKVGCTGCSYCMPCPSGVAIPDIFSQYNGAFLFGGLEERQKNYADFVKQGIDASKCVECASCENACPQHLSIIEKLKEADKVLSK
jgi:predicted aldo/keto reductase-like oxidoreductase